jgi:hypothetical protein
MALSGVSSGMGWRSVWPYTVALLLKTNRRTPAARKAPQVETSPPMLLA